MDTVKSYLDDLNCIWASSFRGCFVSNSWRSDGQCDRCTVDEDRSKYLTLVFRRAKNVTFSYKHNPLKCLLLVLFVYVETGIWSQHWMHYWSLCYFYLPISKDGKGLLCAKCMILQPFLNPYEYINKHIWLIHCSL